MTRSSRDPDAYDRIRDDALTGTNWPDAVPAIPCDICGEPSPVDTDKAAIFHACNQAGVRRRIAELEAQLADATVALQLIAAYGPDGICPYGCDTPDIAANALTAQPASDGGGAA